MIRVRVEDYQILDARYNCIRTALGVVAHEPRAQAIRRHLSFQRSTMRRQELATPMYKSLLEQDPKISLDPPAIPSGVTAFQVQTRNNRYSTRQRGRARPLWKLSCLPSGE
jgi:nitrate reductase cytochrome c-type subunit